MARSIFDTDVLTLAQRGQSAVTQRVPAADPSDLAITVISIEEQLTGWYSLLRQSKESAKRACVYERLAETVTYLGRWSILPYTAAAMDRGARLRLLKLNVCKMDLAIAAIVLD
jgi:tRNA(fMet)-specific endonuclease VapC